MATTVTAPEQLLSRIREAGIPITEKRCHKALALAADLYADKSHWTGVSLLDHVGGVIDLLLPFRPDEDTIIACLLQHVIRLRAMTLAGVEEHFGPLVRRLVSDIHLLSHVTMERSRMPLESLRRVLLKDDDDIRVVLIILCDRCCALDHLVDLSVDARRRLCQEALTLFSPIAARLGIYSIKQQLERGAFPVVYPADAERIDHQLERFHERHRHFLDAAAKKLTGILEEEGITARVEGREKQPYSIFMKMKAKSLTSIESIYDLIALRVVVRDIESCYRVLGVFHRVGHPLGNRFKDYIAFPKPNGYQSLHTAMARLPGFPEGVFCEVQVRTEEMHREAEFGIAAHWSYKESGKSQQAARRVQLARMLSTPQTVAADHIFVLTPTGDIIELPEGAIPLDFAFQIHTNLGLSFRAAHVNGGIVPFDYELQNGDVVEILRHSVPRPSAEWLQVVRMASSRARLRRYLYAKDRSRYVARGRDLLNAELKKRTLPPLDGELSILAIHADRALDSDEREDLLMKIGQGSEKSSAMLGQLPRLKVALQKTAAPAAVKRVAVRGGALVELERGLRMPHKYAQCCKPNEGARAPITAVVNRRGAVMIHCKDCRMVKGVNPERRVSVKWVKD